MIVNNTGRYIRHFGDTRITPGVNKLKEKQVKEFSDSLKNPLNQFMVDCGEIIVESQDGTFGALKLDKALELIIETFDLNLLESFLKEEHAKGSKKRKQVLKAIEDQIEAIKNPPKEKVVNPE